MSTRVHSRYRRHLADLPVSGRPVVVRLTVRRFFCDHVDCSACTFVEQVPGLTERHARRSVGLQAAVRRYLRAGSVDTLLARGVRASVLDSFKPYLHERLANGVRNATVLRAEIAQRGYTGGYTTLARYLRPLRRVDAAALATLPPRPPPPAVRQVTGWITGLPRNLDPDDAARLHAIRVRCTELDAAVRHVASFARMIKDLSGDEDMLTKWMGAVDADARAALVYRRVAP